MCSSATSKPPPRYCTSEDRYRSTVARVLLSIASTVTCPGPPTGRSRQRCRLVRTRSASRVTPLGVGRPWARLVLEPGNEKPPGLRRASGAGRLPPAGPPRLRDKYEDAACGHGCFRHGHDSLGAVTPSVNLRRSTLRAKGVRSPPAGRRV